jgi:hypothetical protein
MTMFLACLLTIVIETLFFAVVGYRNRVFLLLCALSNAVTNLSLNLLLQLLYMLGADLTIAVYPLEALAVAAEYWIFAAVRGRSLRLLLLVLAANALSYGAGLLIYGHV